MRTTTVSTSRSSSRPASTASSSGTSATDSRTVPDAVAAEFRCREPGVEDGPVGRQRRQADSCSRSHGATGYWTTVYLWPWTS